MTIVSIEKKNFYFCRNLQPYEFKRIVSFMMALKAKFNEAKLLVTMTIPISIRFDYRIYDFDGLSSAVDFINFDFDYLRTEAAYRIGDAIEALDISTDQERVEKLIEAGVWTNKIVMGLHLTGPAFLTTSSGKDEDYFRQYPYGSICKAQIDSPNNWDISFAPAGQTIMKKVGGTKKFSLVMENKDTIGNKVEFAIKRGLGGIAPFHIFSDDASGECDSSYVEFPLMRSIFDRIEKTCGKMGPREKVERIIPDRPPKPEDITEAPKPKRNRKPKQRIPRLETDGNIVCHMPLKSELNKNKIKFDINSADWNLCTHIVAIDETGRGKNGSRFFTLFFFIRINELYLFSIEFQVEKRFY